MTFKAYTPKPGRPLALAPQAYGLEYEVFEGDTAPPDFTVEGRYAVVRVCGPLEQHAGAGWDNYDAILRRASAAFTTAEAPEVALVIDSPGGDFGGALECGRALRALARLSGKKFCAFTDRQALSAGYALACSADEVYVTPSAMVGSIGVWQALVDHTAANAMAGMKVVLVSSGARKLDHNPNASISQGAVDATQFQITAMAGEFFDHVAAMRGVGADSVAALEGGEAMGGPGVALRLADYVVDSWSEFLAGARTRVEAMSSYQEARKSYRSSLAKVAAEDSDDGKQARAALVAMDKEDDKNAKRAESEGEGEGEGEAKKAAKSEEGGEEKEPHAASAAAKAEEPPPKKDEGEAKALALANAVAAELQKMKAADRARADASEKARLLATRPDLDPKVRDFLAAQSLASVAEAVATFPKGAVREYAPAAAGATYPTVQGDGEGRWDDGALAAQLDAAMGITRAPREDDPSRWKPGHGDYAAAAAYRSQASASKGAK